MDLSKAFDMIKHDLLIAKLYAYGFSKESLKLLHNYLSNRWHRTKVNKQFSSWQELTQGVSQESVLGLLLFNIYLNDLFYLAESTNVCNFADDAKRYSCKKTGKKLSVLARLSNFMFTNKKKVLMKAFIESQFGYCPLIFMFH